MFWWTPISLHQTRALSGSLLVNGWAKADWGLSEANRRARYYRLTPAGRKQLAGECAEFDRMVGAIQRVLHAT